MCSIFYTLVSGYQYSSLDCTLSQRQMRVLPRGRGGNMTNGQYSPECECVLLACVLAQFHARDVVSICPVERMVYACHTQFQYMLGTKVVFVCYLYTFWRGPLFITNDCRWIKNNVDYYVIERYRVVKGVDGCMTFNVRLNKAMFGHQN